MAMNENSKQATAPSDAATGTDAQRADQRAYEQSGCYPAEGKPFRLWALLGGLTLVIIGLAVAAALLNIYFLGAPWQAA